MKNKFNDAVECIDDGKRTLGLGLLCIASGLMMGDFAIYAMGIPAALNISLGLFGIWEGNNERVECLASGHIPGTSSPC